MGFESCVRKLTARNKPRVSGNRSFKRVQLFSRNRTLRIAVKIDELGDADCAQNPNQDDDHEDFH